jgi:diamine N-acetyltransferase
MIPDPDRLVFLRALASADLERTLKWHNDPDLYRTLGGIFRPVSRQTEAEWLEKAARWSVDSVQLAICVAASGEHVGNIALKSIDSVRRHAELHVFLGETDQRGKGFGAAAIRALLTHARADLGLNRIYLEVLADHVAAIHVYEKCGFQPEGRLREHAFKDGRFRDVLVMGCLLHS